MTFGVQRTTKPQHTSSDVTTALRPAVFAAELATAVIWNSAFWTLIFDDYVHAYWFVSNAHQNKWKSAQRDANTARAGCIARFRHRPPARCHKPTDSTDYNTLHRSAQCNYISVTKHTLQAPIRDAHPRRQSVRTKTLTTTACVTDGKYWFLPRYAMRKRGSLLSVCSSLSYIVPNVWRYRQTYFSAR